MRRKNIKYFVLTSLIGAALIVIADIFGDSLSNGATINGVGFGILVSGLVNIFTQWRMTRPENREKYEERLRRERIESRDEMKTMLRQRAAHLTYIIMFEVLFFTGLVLAFLNAEQWIIILVFALLMVQYLLGVIVYQVLLRRQTGQ